MIKLLHFADAHIDMANYGRHDPETGLPVRVMDFLHALDQIIDSAVEQEVDLVIFAGDTYKGRNPQPTFQRAWGQRMMRLSLAGIPTLLLVGNHDVAPATGRAHTMQEYKTLQVPHIHVADQVKLWRPEELGVPVQIMTIPWVARSAMMTRDETAGKSLSEVLEMMEDRLSNVIQDEVRKADPEIPLILAAHACVQGAKYGSERAVMLGNELVLSGAVVNDKRLDYVALGHIHKHQSLNGDRQPPIVYPGSIERIDFGEAKEAKGFVLAEVSPGHTDWQFVHLNTRRFLDITVETNAAESFMVDVMNQLPQPEEVVGAICRVKLSYPRDWEPLVDETAIEARFKEAHSFKLQKNRDVGARSRLGDTVAVESLTPLDLLDQYWMTIGLEDQEKSALRTLAKDILTVIE